jgi:hypothetical protein
LKTTIPGLTLQRTISYILAPRNMLDKANIMYGHPEGILSSPQES